MDVSAVTGMKAAEVQSQAVVQVLKKALEAQTEMMKELFASMGVGQNIDVQA